jgi:hypothetical protein
MRMWRKINLISIYYIGNSIRHMGAYAPATEKTFEMSKKSE